MRRLVGGVLTALFGLVVLVPSLQAGSKQATGRLAQARYVALGYDLGDRFLSERQAIVDSDRVTPEDRRALEVIRERLEDWDRYVIVDRPDQAELLVVVRKGRRMVLGGGLPVGPVGGGQAEDRTIVQRRVSSAADMLDLRVQRRAAGHASLARDTGERPPDRPCLRGFQVGRGARSKRR
jgi:hypothetical protein